MKISTRLPAILFIVLAIFLLNGGPLFSQTHKKPAPSQKSQKKPSPGQGKKSTASTSLFQNNTVINFTPGQIDTFQLESVQLVNFFQGMLNFLTDPSNAVRDKQTIITQSYLKIFWDSKVQIEDDLEQNRLVPLYKDAPSYLTDVSFFFPGAKFTYTVQNASVLTSATGQTYFRVTANRNLKGVTINGDSVNWNKVRYIEINYNDSMQQLKIVSIYTTKLNEREDMKTWWNGLPPAWKTALGTGVMVYDTLPLGHIITFRDSVAVLRDTDVKVDSNRIYNAILGLINRKTVDLSGNASISDLSPLGKLSGLTSVNISNTSVSDITALRNLNNLEELDISGTKVISLDALKYATKITMLKMAKTGITDFSLIPGFTSLEVLDLSETPVENLGIVTGLSELTDLRFSGTKVGDLAPVSGLSKLEILYFNDTPVKDLAPLKGISKLQLICCNGTKISDLSPLDGLPDLKRIYCNNTLISDEKASQYAKKNMSVLVIYESEELTKWWSTVPAEWKKIFGYYTKLDDPPNTEQLHRLAAIDSINITGRTSITSLTPLSAMTELRRLECANSGITDLKPLEKIITLENINISSTKVASVVPLSGLKNLQVLNMDNTLVSDLTPLSKITALKNIYADNTGVNLQEALSFAGANPECLVIFQTYENTNWWKNLTEDWKQVFQDQFKLTGLPDKMALQQVAFTDKVSITGKFQITSLQPVLHLARLKDLEFTDTRIASLDVLQSMKQIEILVMAKNPISDLTPIGSLTGLKVLDFSNTQVEELEPIQNLTNLETLKFSGTPVKNLKYLARMVNLKNVEMFNTRVSNIDVLEPMKGLVSLKIFNTKISEKKVDKFKQTHIGCEIIFY